MNPVCLRRVTTACALSLLVLLPAVASAQFTETPDQLRTLLAARLGTHPTAGIVVGLLEPSGNRRIVAVGKMNDGRPLDGRAVFEIGSISKVFTSAILSDMVGRGEVSLTDPAARLLPNGRRLPERDGVAISLEHLSTHTSGLPRMPGNFSPKNIENPYADYTVEQLYDFLGRYQLPRAIGERYEYSNLGVGLLGHLLATRAGRSYEDLLIERVARPLGLKDTRITLSAETRGRLAHGHTAGGYPTANWDLPALAGAGAIRSTVDDMLTFLAANLPDAQGPLAAALARTHQPRKETGRQGIQVGLGWHITTKDGLAIVWHNGGTGGYHSFAGFDPKTRRAVVVLHNTARSIDDIGFHLLDATVPLEKASPLPLPRREVTVPAEVLDTVVGWYELSPVLLVNVTREGRQLYLQVTGQPKLPIFAESDSQFFLKAVDGQVSFVKGPGGLATEAVLKQDGGEQRAKRRQRP